MTLWLTRIHLDPRLATVRADLANAVRLHQRVMSLMPDDLGDQPRLQTGLLYRIDETPTGTHLLIQSRHRPDPTKLPPGYGDTATRDLTPLLDRLDTGTDVHYRLIGNTTKRAGRTSPRPGKLVALRGPDAEQWWTSRAERCGLHLATITATSLNDIRGRPKDTDPKTGIRHAATRFDGIATITDPDAVRRAVHEGIGRGKSHGCGLLSLAIAR
ncbi:type I-E CRISPR-associated protein Cas6/Cse3/CasE [Nocardia amamiensis]|uniref:type I-E CRISPR-associated protein Cas6/Cse3/CasE n=1 Tax=Nocardia amamiensis TaxID=404578 RepID=UPI0033F1514C